MGQKYQIVNGVKCQVDVNGKLLIKGEGVYELPIASETQLGGVAPKNKIAGMEYNDVYVDGVGRLYAPQGDAYILPVATPSTLGGVKPNAKTDAMTASVGVDSEGKLYVQPVQGPAGPQGPEGPRGPEGVQGPAGRDGSDGRDGIDGSDGTSAYATVSKAGNTATITCTDANGTTTAQVSDGIDGRDGTNGTSAFASVSKSGNTATITCTDSNGTTTAQVTDGSDGRNGTDGKDGNCIWTATADPTTPNYTFNISDLSGPTGYTPQVGDIVVRSVYRYTISSVSSSTVLAGNRVSIRGAKGDTGATGAGVASGGTAGQILAKASGTDYDTEWINAPSGGGAGPLFEQGTKVVTGTACPWFDSNYDELAYSTIKADIYKWGNSAMIKLIGEIAGGDGPYSGIYNASDFVQFTESDLRTLFPDVMAEFDETVENMGNGDCVLKFYFDKPVCRGDKGEMWINGTSAATIGLSANKWNGSVNKWTTNNISAYFKPFADNTQFRMASNDWTMLAMRYTIDVQS